MTDTTCKICHRNTPPEGRQVCDSCMGFERTEPTEPPRADRSLNADLIPTETELELCQICGSAIEPYKVGKCIVKSRECRDCYYKRRYGPNWKPGGQTREEKAANCKAYRQAKKSNGGNGEEAPPKQPTVNPVPAEPDMPSETIPEYPTIIVPFEGPDEGIYFRLRDISTKERRSLEQQILYFLDRVVEERI